MTTVDYKKLLLGTSVLAGFAAMTFAAPVYAQTADEDEAPIQVQTVEENEEEGDEVVVTGSRLKKSTFSSTAPLQVLTTEDANQEGLFSPVDILQTNAAASGQQIDSTFQGFVLDNGPGSETINLRALGANRTLVLLNNRRMAPSGVEGAPTQPSINLVPSTMVDRFDLLLDGASAVYGSDAVAGVVNVLLRNDYDGLELSAFADSPEFGDGQDYTIGARYGVNGDRGFIGGAIEFDYQDPWTTADREFLNGCETFREVTENGEIRTVNEFDAFDAQSFGLTAPTSPCRATRLTQRIIPFSTLNAAGTRRVGNGSIYYQPEIANSGIGPFSESTLFSVPFDGNGDGIRDVNFWEFSPNGDQADAQQLVNEQNQFSFFVNGEYTFEGDMNITPYFEVLFADRDIKATSQQPQLFPVVPFNNQFNPCNINAPGGIDCAAAYNAQLENPDFAARFAATYGLTPAQFRDFGILDIFSRTGVSLNVQPVVGVRGDRNVTDVNIQQTRLLGGVRGDLPGINFAQFNDWTFDLSTVYSFSNGTSSRSGIRSDRLDLALGVNPATGALLNAPCENTGDFDQTLLNGCVPVNMFAPSLYQVSFGADFATQAERDYLFDSRDFDTFYGQLLIDLSVQGDVYTLPGGEVSLLLGASFRKDELNSTPDDIARDGLFFGFFSDAGAAGDRTVNEFYGEAFIPLGTGEIGLRELNLELAGRITDDEFYGTNNTYSVKAGWRPIDSLLLRATAGTSFRAPNLRELFLRGQSGFGTLGDPCAVPDAAFDIVNGYTAANDPRSQVTLNNCVSAGLDPTTFLAGQFSAYSVELNTQRNQDLDPETSESFTIGASFEQPFTDAFDLSLGVTYFDLTVNDTIIEESAAFLINDCYNVVAGFTSLSCGKIVRDFTDLQNPGVIDIVNASFQNRFEDTAQFVDYNFRFDKDNIAFMEKSWDIFARGQFSQYIERKFTDIQLDGTTLSNDFVGDFGVPEWVGSATFGLTQDRWQAAWTTRYIDGVETDETNQNGVPVRAVNDFTNYVDGSVVTCGGPTQNDVNCRPVFSADEYFVHNLSIGYRGDDWNLLMGVNNIFNDEPPLVSPREVFSVNNVPLGNGYDLNGREYFVRVRKTFR